MLTIARQPKTPAVSSVNTLGEVAKENRPRRMDGRLKEVIAKHYKFVMCKGKPFFQDRISIACDVWTWKMRTGRRRREK
jgi:hypothetical protein